MKQEELAKIVSDAVERGVKIAFEQWQRLVYTTQSLEIDKLKLMNENLSEQTKQMKIMAEREFVQCQHAEKMNGDTE